MKRLLVTAFLTGAFALTSSAQINARRVDQQDRIAAGIRDGQLSPRETVHLERREGAINHEIRADRFTHDGRLTPAERERINHQQNVASHHIFVDRHN